MDGQAMFLCARRDKWFISRKKHGRRKICISRVRDEKERHQFSLIHMAGRMPAPSKLIFTPSLVLPSSLVQAVLVRCL